jgi:hypothetical protein
MSSTQILLLAATFISQAATTCMAPEPDYRICYNQNGATPQNLTMKDVAYSSKYLRYYGQQEGNSPFFTMKVKDADNCAEWQAFTKGSTMVLAKLVGEQDASVTFNDIANTIDGGTQATDADKAKVLWGCDTNGGQMAVVVNATDPLYKSPDYVNGKFVNTGIIIKLVHNNPASMALIEDLPFGQ